jgi:Flp pilus assembly protein TadG
MGKTLMSTSVCVATVHKGFSAVWPSSCRLAAKAAHFWQDRRAGIAPVAALAALPLMGAVGAAVDFSHALALRTAMQGALDATALWLIKQQAAGADVSEQVQSIFSALYPHPEVANISVTFNGSNGANSTSVGLTASGAVPTTFMRVMGNTAIDISASSAAYIAVDTSGCVLALDSTASGALAVGGSATINLKGCSIFSNSNSATALTAGGSSNLSATMIGVVGGVSISGSNVTTTEGIRTGMPQLADPYRDATFPPFSGCAQNNFTAKTTITISPGVYCNGISVNAGAELTLSPGIYYIDRGSFNVNGGGTVSGTGVTLVFTSSTGNNWATASINGNAVVSLTAPKSGSTAGIVIFGDRRIPIGTSYKFNGDSNQTFAGAIYLPTAAISYSGGTGTSTSCTQIIGDTVNFTGNSDVAVNCSSYPTKPFGPVTVRITS